MPAFELVIFDCDGVLVDSEHISNRIFGAMLANLGLELTPDELYGKFLGRTMQDCVRIASDLLGRAPPDDFVERYHTECRKAFATELQSVPGIRAVIESLTVPFCVASSGEHEKMRTTLGVTGLQAHFEGKLFSATEVVHGKPAPDLFLHAARQQQIAASRCLVIEDSPAGVMAGVAAGMTVFGYAALTPSDRLEEAGAHRIFHSMEELPGLIDLGG